MLDTGIQTPKRLIDRLVCRAKPGNDGSKSGPVRPGFVLIPFLLIVTLATPALGEISIFNLKNSLIQFALGQISTPDFTITAENVEEPEDGATSLVGVKIADEQGVWFTAESLSVNWNSSRILRGELELNSLAAVGVQVLRRPASFDVEVKEDAEIAEDDGDPFDWPRAPLATRIEEMRLERVFIAEGVIGAQSLAFEAVGKARDEGDEQSLALTLTRTDAVSGEIALDYLRDFATNELRLSLSAAEAAGGLVADLAGLPNESASRVEIDAKGPLTDWALTFQAATERVFAAEGTARVVAQGPLAVDAGFVLVPGEALDPAVAQVLAPEARLDVKIAEDAQGVVRIERGAFTSPALTLTARGSYAKPTGQMALNVDLSGGAALADLAEGVAFSGFGFKGQITGTQEALEANGAIALDGLATAPFDLGTARLDGRVSKRGARIEASLAGMADRVRIDKLTPDLIGKADLAVDGAFDGETATLAAFRFASPLLTAEADGSVNLRAERAALDYAVTAPALAPIAKAYDAEAGGRFQVRGRAEGPLSAIAVTGDLALTEAVLEGEPYGDVRLGHDVTLGKEIAGRIDLAASGSPYGPIAAKGGFRVAGEIAEVEEMTASALGARLSGSAVHDLKRQLTEGRIDLDIPDLATLEPLTRAPVSGRLAGRVGLRPEDGRQQVALDLTGLGLTGYEAELAALQLKGLLSDALGAPALVAEIAVEQAAYRDAKIGQIEGTLDARDLTGAPMAEARLTLKNAAYGDARAATVAAEVAAQDLTGTPRAKGRLTVTGAAYQDARLARLVADVDAVDLTGTPDADFDIAVENAKGFDAAVARLTAKGRVEDAEALGALNVALTADSLAYRENTVGRLVANLSGNDLLGPARRAEIDATAETIAAAGARIASARLSGTATEADGKLNLAADARLGQIAQGDARIAGLTLSAKAEDALGPDPALRAQARTGAVSAGAAKLNAVIAMVSGKLSALAATAKTEGTVADTPIALDTAARANLTATPLSATLTKADMAYGDERIGLNRPLRVRAGESTRLDDIDLSLPGGGLTGNVALHPGGLAGALALRLADLGLARRLADLPVTEGSLALDTAFDTRPGSARATLDLSAPGLRFADILAEAGALDIAAQGRWNGRQAEIDGTIGGPFGEPVRARASLPLRPGLPPAVPANGTISGALRWAGRVGELWVLVPAPDHVLDGDLKLDLGVSGTLAAPRLAGSVSLAEGHYENLALGTILTGLTVGSEIDSAGALVLDLAADDAAKGKVTARVAVDGDRLDAKLESASAVLIRRDDATAAISLDLAARGPLTGPDISGRVGIDKAEIRLVNATPPTVADLGPVRIKGAPVEPEAPPAGGDIGLDIRVQAPRDVFVRGRGLDSEWKIGLDISGTAAAPRITGAVERVRGYLDLIGTRFDLATGAISFSGATPVDPDLDVQLIAENEGVTGGIVIGGRASDPQIGFSSRPALPEEEVLPRILFGKSRQSLTGSQAIRLAAGLATLLDGTGGTVDRVRGAVGLDQLAIDPSSEGATVTVGKNVADGVFVGAKQSLDGAESAVTVEVEVFEDITVDGEVTPGGNSSVGVNWKTDF